MTSYELKKEKRFDFLVRWRLPDGRVKRRGQKKQGARVKKLVDEKAVMLET